MLLESHLSFRNTARWDRGVRLAVGLALLLFGWSSGDPWTVWMRVAGLYPLVTGLIGWCPIYTLLRVATEQRTPGRE